MGAEIVMEGLPSAMESIVRLFSQVSGPSASSARRRRGRSRARADRPSPAPLHPQPQALAAWNASARLVWWITLLVLAGVFTLFLRNSLVRVVYALPLENGEGLCLGWSLRMVRGEALYPPLSASLPFVGCNYPPLFLWVASLFVSPESPSLLPMRAISFVSVFGMVLAIYGIARRAGAGRFGAAFGALMVFTVPYVNETAVLGRVDWLAAFLSLGGLWLVWPREKAVRPWIETARMAVGFVLFALAVLAKQTMIWAPVAWALWAALDWRKQWRRIAALVGVGLLIHGAVLVHYGGDYFRWVGTYSSGRYSRLLMWFGLQYLLAYHLFLVLPAVALGLWATAKRHAGSPRGTGGAAAGSRSLLFMTLAVATLWLLLMGRRGASFHYSIPFSAVLCAVTGWLTSQFLESAALRPRENAVAAIVFLLAIGVGLAQYRLSLLKWDHPHKSLLARQDRRVLRIIEALPGPILTEDLAYEVLTRKPAYLENPFMYSDLARRGIINPAPLLEDLAGGKVSCVCLASPVTRPNSVTRDRFTDEILRAVRTRYPYELPVGYQHLYFRTTAERDAAGAR